MTYDEFEKTAHRMWDEIPEEYREGVDGVVVQRDAEGHPDHEGYYTLGMCFTEPYPSGYQGPETTRSFVALYHGSFAKIAERSPDFDWEEELWETITHELRHHLEFLAEADALEGLDYAMEETFKRGEGEEFDPWYYQSGIPLAPGVYRVEYDVYVEQHWTDEALARAERIEFDWDGRRWAVPNPGDVGDLHYVWVRDVDVGGGWLQLVIVRKRSLWARFRRYLDREPLDLVESELDAEVVGDAPDSPRAGEGRPGRAAGGPPEAPPRPEREGGSAGPRPETDDDRAGDDGDGPG